jgi:hypothetical protein
VEVGALQETTLDYSHLSLHSGNDYMLGILYCVLALRLALINVCKYQIDRCMHYYVLLEEVPVLRPECGCFPCQYHSKKKVKL